jgi:hypothetical protein
MDKDLIHDLVESQLDLGVPRKLILKDDIANGVNSHEGLDPINDIIFRAGYIDDIEEATSYIDYCISQLKRASKVLSEYK